MIFQVESTSRMVSYRGDRYHTEALLSSCPTTPNEGLDIFLKCHLSMSTLLSATWHSTQDRNWLQETRPASKDHQGQFQIDFWRCTHPHLAQAPQSPARPLASSVLLAVLVPSHLWVRAFTGFSARGCSLPIEIGSLAERLNQTAQTAGFSTEVANPL